ncbi:hypothetical protein H7849_23555 [Alloacidobacterium dinghuense]|uniref:Uncharacterized protein n=1 Tax=Alloacidobacterium dinghuense TaxID=2763107 RepID=A0A7G8BRP8_9BACT|nr:hypothetical protein [Alloacidobacterium dinghuense]QNI35218.1 hypothetical protein H7849_23555 [Alloacidobacterium dinghuense]
MPLVSAHLTLRAGSTADPAGLKGAANITADLDFIGMQYGDRVTALST